MGSAMGLRQTLEVPEVRGAVEHGGFILPGKQRWNPRIGDL